MSEMASVRILINQNGSSNKIWAQVGMASTSGKHPVIYGPIRKDGAGLTEGESKSTWHDKEKGGYQFVATFDHVPDGMERTCVAGVAHMFASGHPDSFMGPSSQETAFGRKCAEHLSKRLHHAGLGLTIRLDQPKEAEPEPVPPKQDKAEARQGLDELLKTRRSSSYF